MKNKILSYYLILILIGLAITGFFTFYLTQQFYKQEVEEKLVNSSELIRYQILEDMKKNSVTDASKLIGTDDTANFVINFNKAALSYSNILKGIRITFVDYEGHVLGESETNYRSMENHLNRKEIQEAIKNGIGKDIRFSGTLDMNFLYVAMPIEDVKAVIRLSVPLVQIQKIQNIIWNYELFGILAVIIITSLLALKFSSMVTRPIDELIVKSHEIASGNYGARVQIKSCDEIGQLAESFNDMADKLGKTVTDLMDKNLKMDTILNSMTDGIIAVDKNYKIILINHVACRLFEIEPISDMEIICKETTAKQITDRKIIGSDFMELIRNSTINKMLKETMQKRVMLSEEINVSYSGGKIYRVTVVPIQQGNVKLNYYVTEFSNPYISCASDVISRFSQGVVVSIQNITNLKKLEQIRTEFVSNVTHELKTPLTSIRGFVETLRSGTVNNSEVADKFLEIIDIEAERLYTLINDILQLSEIESGSNDTNMEIHNIKQLIDESVTILKTEAVNKEVTVQTDDVDSNILIFANKDRIKQMFINLIDNSIKYNIPGGSVSISAYKDEGKLIIKIKDTGIGISKEHLPRIFERFYRVDKGRSRNLGGTGLGLSIVKHIVNLYSGNIKVYSQPEQGTEFIIQLPAQQ